MALPEADGEAEAVGDALAVGLTVVVGDTDGDALTVGDGEAELVGDGVGLAEVHPAAAKIKETAAAIPINFFFMFFLLCSY